GTPDDVTKKAQTKDAKHNARHPRQVVDGDADSADQGPWLGILAQIQGSQDAKGDYRQRHQQGQGSSAPESRPNSSFAVDVARLVREELPPAGLVNANLVPKTKLIGRISPHDVAKGQVLLLAIGRGQTHLESVIFLVEDSNLPG